MINKSAVGNRITEYRKALGFSQAELAEKLHVSTQAVSKWETGLSLPDIETLLNLSWICKVSINAILDGDDYTYNGIDRGLSLVSRYLTCPECRESLCFTGEGNSALACKNGHSYAITDGVIDFGTREIQGELWSLLFKNYDHYLHQQRDPGNPRYLEGSPDFKEAMWQHIKKHRPRTILDIACGMGTGMRYIIERIDWPVTVIMADVSHRILKYNRTFFAEECRNPYVDMVYIACDCADLPLVDGCMDMVFSNGGFESMREKMMPGFKEGFRVLKNGVHAVYNISAVEDFQSENTGKWIKLYTNRSSAVPADESRLHDINHWLEICRQTGYQASRADMIYGELPAPNDSIFPFENEVLQWMAEYVVISQK